MIISRDEIETFIPKANTRLVIVGTMCSTAARSVGDRKAASDAFYYYSPINRFWKVVQLVFESKGEPKNLSLAEKIAFLERYGIALINIVSEIRVPENLALDPSDTVLFDAHKQGNLKFKTASGELKKILQSTPVFFTCRFKKDIYKLLQGYIKFNELEEEILEKIWYLHSPTRRSSMNLSSLWKEEIFSRL